MVRFLRAPFEDWDFVDLRSLFLLFEDAIEFESDTWLVICCGGFP
jgi:hypothetical protein